ncbi:MAG: trypsin-like peptidase domain-containing protein [Betaproteobacteria bacterium]|nr:MAG: trypsin-like peptidase domain-containing protein [Betaproteobacteria bacterium]
MSLQLRYLGGVLIALCAGGLARAQTAPDPAEAKPSVSASAQRAYETTRDKLLQVRTLLKDQDSQASVGSGFIVSDEGHVITNYHVVSQVALQPQRYRLTYTRAEGSSGQFQLLAFDAVHNLALLRMVPLDKAAAVKHAALAFRPRDKALAKGERIFSLGNPLDVGFAVLEGNYNGLAERSFYPQIFFAGALNPGMSGGPALDGEGRVMGVNVATRRDGQMVSFLVPAQFAIELLERGRNAPPITTDVYPELTRQLFTHQALLTQKFIAQQWRSAGHARYRIPVPQEDFMRCWGSSSPAETKGLEFQRSDCQMDNAVFVSGRLQTGHLTVRHEAYDGSKLGVLRFSRAYSASFRNEFFGGGASTTAPQCKERFVDRDGLPLRAVVCLSAYRKLKGLYDVSVLVATVDASKEGVQGRLDARGFDFDNALRLTDHYLQGFAWNGSH